MGRNLVQYIILITTSLKQKTTPALILILQTANHLKSIISFACAWAVEVPSGFGHRPQRDVRCFLRNRVNRRFL
jgi:hypothetical protein